MKKPNYNKMAMKIATSWNETEQGYWDWAQNTLPKVLEKLNQPKRKVK